MNGSFHGRCFRLLLSGVLMVGLPGCYGLQGSSGGGQTTFDPPRRVNPADVAMPDGYRIEPVATDLTFPTAVAFDDQNRPHVVEAGYSYGEAFTTPRLLRVEPGGGVTVIAEGKNGPWNGVTFHEGAFYIAEGGVIEGGRILRIDPEDGRVTPLIENLPSVGDHQTNGPAIGPDGWLYFGVGTATNSGVVGTDNADFGWLHRFPDFHDIPAEDITLTGRNFTTENPLTEAPDDEAVTGAYSPFGTSTESGQVIPGRTLCNGAILRIPPGGGEPEVVAWGLRNPYGLAFSPDGVLYVTENSYDVRGSRPIWGSGDVLWEIEPGTWYGWPDFHGGRPLTRSDHYQPPNQSAPQFLLAEHPNDPPDPAAKLGVHASANGFDFSRSESFGHTGQAFIAEFGDMAPDVGKVLAPVGFRVVRVEVDGGVIHNFAANRGEKYGPASKVGGGGLERPVSARFDNEAEALYIVDFGVMTMTDEGPRPHEETGVLWRITREERP